MTPISNQPIGRRRHLLAALIATPTILTALGVTALEAWRFHRPDSPLFVTPRVDSLADAIANDDVRRAYEFIRAGQDPNDLIAVRHPVLTDGRLVQVSPLLWAVATKSRQAVLMLLGFGARIDATSERQAVCLAEQLGRDDIAEVLELHGGHLSPEPCPRQEASEAGLLGALTEPE